MRKKEVAKINSILDICDLMDILLYKRFEIKPLKVRKRTRGPGPN